MTDFWLSLGIGLAFLFGILWFLTRELNAPEEEKEFRGGSAMAGALFEFFDADQRKGLEVVVQREAGEESREDGAAEPEETNPE